MSHSRKAPNIWTIGAGVVLGSFVAAVWESACAVVWSGVTHATDPFASEPVSTQFAMGFVMMAPIVVVFVLLGLPLYAFGRVTRTANLFTAAILGFLLGFAGSGLFGSFEGRLRDLIFAAVDFGWSGVLAGLVFWSVVEGIATSPDPAGRPRIWKIS